MTTLCTFCNSISTQKRKESGVRIFYKSLIMMTLLWMLSTNSFSQSNGWSATMEPQKVFIENQGQFDNAPTGDAVLFAFYGGSTSIYFTNKGVSYTFLKRWAKEKDENEGEEKFTTADEWKEKEAEEHRMEFESDAVTMNWVNANPDVEIVGYDKTSDYHSFCIKDISGKTTNKNFIKAFKKIVYKNIYPGIDIEYVFHPDGGLKYAVILHPGADISKVQMNYSVAPEIKINGDVHLPTKFGDIIDHAPATFYSEMKSRTIPSHFIKNGTCISFSVNPFDITKDVVIDPWTQTPSLPNSNGVWECEHDGAGNVYMIGGDMPMQLMKYNATGVIQFTYYTPYDTANDWLGTFATDLAGNSYVTSGSIAAMQKIDATGSMVWDFNSSLGSTNEYWNIAFNCDQTKLIIGGTTGSMLALSGAIFDINTSNGSINSTKIVGYGNMFGFPPIIEECRSITSCRNSRYYYLTLDTIGAIDDDFSVCPTAGPTVFAINNSYSFSYKCENYRPNNGNSGMMSIRANRNFVYTQNGTTIHKRSLIDGSIITTATIPGGQSTAALGRNQAGNSGIDIDSCGNVYVGSADGIYKFDADLNFITSIATPYKIFDVSVSTGGDVIFCGATGTNADVNRTGYLQSANMSACLPQVLICCDASVCPVPPMCVFDAPVTISAGTPGGVWSGAGVNPSTGVFDPGAAGIGTHTITYTVACGTNSINIVVMSCAVLDVCKTLSGNLTVSGGIGPYNWQSQNITQDCSACLIGCTFPPGCAVNVTTWTTFATGNTVTPPATYPIQVVDNYGVVFTIADTALLALCSPCPTLIITPTNIVDVCFGQTNGSFTASTSGGVLPYRYTLLSGVTPIATYNNVSTSQDFTGLAAGTYTLNVLDSNNCTNSITVTIASLTSLTPIIMGPTSICTGNTATLDVGAGYSSYIWSTSAITQTITVGAGTYSVTVTNGSGCSGSTSTTITAFSMTVNLTPQDEGCPGTCDGSITSNVIGGNSPYTYLWSNGQTTSNIIGLCAGNYAVTVTDSNACTKVTNVTIYSENISASFVANPESGALPLSVAFTYTGSGAVSWYWDFGNGQTSTEQYPPIQTYDTVGSYNVTLIVSSGAPDFCKDTAHVTIEVQKPSSLIIPNIFTPNGDGHNDEFILLYKEIETFSCSIFNRWGKKIFEWTDISGGWNGITNGGEVASDGVYFYIIYAKGKDKVEYNLHGTVTLLR